MFKKDQIVKAKKSWSASPLIEGDPNFNYFRVLQGDSLMILDVDDSNSFTKGVFHFKTGQNLYLATRVNKSEHIEEL
jgi:hypothetical protein